MSELSPAAQAVLDAYRDADIDDAVTAAAVLRAAADQVITDNRLAALNSESHAEARLLLVWVRDQLLAIANELGDDL